MKILYDFQESFADIGAGIYDANAGDKIVVVRKDPTATGIVEVVEDVKTLRVTERVDTRSGIYIHLKNVKGLMAGDRIAVTGRIGEGSPAGKWSIALISVDGGNTTPHISPGAIFSLSHILDENELDESFTVHTLGWGVTFPLMDFYVDGILITRSSEDSDVQVDTRTNIYSLESEKNLDIISIDDNDPRRKDLLIMRSGIPNIRVLKRDGKNALHINNRVNDWDSVDINISNMNLISGNKYELTVTGRMDGDVSEGTMIMLQGLPSFAWHSNIPIKKDEEFTLTHVLSHAAIEKWNAVRITTNTSGASAAFFVYSIDIVRL
jgi:hypothetical protein